MVHQRQVSSTAYESEWLQTRVDAPNTGAFVIVLGYVTTLVGASAGAALLAMGGLETGDLHGVALAVFAFLLLFGGGMWATRSIANNVFGRGRDHWAADEWEPGGGGRDRGVWVHHHHRDGDDGDDGGDAGDWGGAEFDVDFD